MFSVPTEIPQDFSDVVLIPGIAIFFGLLIYLLGEFNPNLKGPKAWKIVGGLILIGGALSGFRYFLAMVSGSSEGEMYRSLLFQRRMIYSHYIGFWLPVAILAILIIVTIIRSRRRNLMYDEF